MSATALIPRRLSPDFPVYGWSWRWLAVNLRGFWMQVPFGYFEVNRSHVELRIGGYKYGVTFDVRWRWE